jgi:ferritin-like metal-binding protein YciE
VKNLQGIAGTSLNNNWAGAEKVAGSITAYAGTFSEVAMKLMIEQMPDLQALYIRQLRLLLSAEEMIAIKTQMLIDAATDPELHQALRDHLHEDDGHAARLRDILTRITGKADPLKCKVIYALFDEAEDLMEDAGHESVRNVILIAAAQRIEHYEIAAYGAVRQFARVLGRTDDAMVLDMTIQEEGHADHQLTQIAERINPAAQKAA